MKRGFSLAEMMATVTIIAILSTMIMVYFPSYSSRVASVVDSGNLETLNKALEMYKVQGGIQLAHSLAGPNIRNTTGKTAIINTLKNGFTQGGIKLKFLDSSLQTNPASLTTYSSGSLFGFNYPAQLYRLTITKRYIGTEYMIQLSEFKLKNGVGDIAWPVGTSIAALHASYTPNGNVTSYGRSEDVSRLIDGTTGTKYGDSGFNSDANSQIGSAIIVISVGNRQILSPTGYDIANGNDTATHTGREPISWTLEVSTDNVNWTTLSTVSDYTSTFANFDWIGPFTF